MKTLFLFLFEIGTIQAQWETIETPYPSVLQDACFIDSDIGYIVGGGDIYKNTKANSGIVLKTMDCGISWEPIFEHEEMSFIEVSFFNELLHIYGISLENENVRLSFRNDTLIETKKIEYFPNNIITRENQIFFLENSNLYIESEHKRREILPNISSYSIVHNKIVALSLDLDIFYFETDSLQFEQIKVARNAPFAAIYSENSLYKNMDTILIRGYYPGVSLFSFDLGENWSFFESGYDRSNYILSSKAILVLDKNNIQKSSDFGETWLPFLQSETNIQKIINVENKFLLAFGSGARIMRYKLLD